MVRYSARQVFSATRTHFPANTAELPEVVVSNLKKYAISTQALGIGGAVAVNCLQEKVKAVIDEAAPDADIEVLHVPVWGAFVPALNTLLGEAQRRHSKFILFQSLEVVCDRAVLRRMLDFHTSETLVVGPVLNGHTFADGLQALNGRTTPWNTLALWSTRKLGLTGFLSVAEGLPDGNAVTRQMSGESDAGTPGPPAMGTEAWWDGRLPGDLPASLRTKSLAREVPAGVEEVTVIALLQHLLGEPQARAVLIDLPKSMDSKVTWKVDWAGDEKRRQWHEHKMKTKITRPAAQMKRLFGLGSKHGRAVAPFLPCRRPLGEGAEEQQVQYGQVHHFGESIAPPVQVESICMCCSMLFMATVSSAFSVALNVINTSSLVSSMTFAVLLLAGVYLPMPLSLFLLRWMSNVAGQRAGLLFFAAMMVVTHIAVALIQAVAMDEHSIRWMLVAVRLLQGLAAAVLFQTRFILSQVSTQDKHVELQAKTFLAGDFGLGMGALLPYLCSHFGGGSSSVMRPEIYSSVILALVGAVLLMRIWVAFPASPFRLSHQVRFPEPLPEPSSAQHTSSAAPPSAASLEGGLAAALLQHSASGGELSGHSGTESGLRSRMRLILSGTLRVFVQSAACMTIAMCMRSAGEVHLFRQSWAVALLCLVPVPFEAIASGLWLKTSAPGLQTHSGKISFALLVAMALLCMWTTMEYWLGGAKDEMSTSFIMVELMLLKISLALVAPLNVSKLYQHNNAEGSLVTLEWVKAYVGRLAGPLAAVLVQNFLGLGPLMAMLFTCTCVVAVTA